MFSTCTNVFKSALNEDVPLKRTNKQTATTTEEIRSHLGKELSKTIMNESRICN